VNEQAKEIKVARCSDCKQLFPEEKLWKQPTAGFLCPECLSRYTFIETIVPPFSEVEVNVNPKED